MSKEELIIALESLTEEHLDIILAMVEEMNAHSQKISVSLCRMLVQQVSVAA